ncbi:MAG: rsmG [Nocardioidaceae bacterium]|nr:rsmG [Nocardioidaceae bacterium]
MTDESSVSRETPPVPELARGVFRDRTELAVAYAGLLCTDGVERGLIGPREAPRIWERHLLNCAVVTDGIPVGSRVIDIGSGAGLPGLVLAIRRSDLAVTLAEPLLRRSTFLSEVVGTLGLSNVEVVRARAEDLHGGAAYDVVTSRAVAPLEKLLRWSMPLATSGGSVLAMKGSSVSDELAQARRVVHRLGGGSSVVETYGADWLPEPTTVVRVVMS